MFGGHKRLGSYSRGFTLIELLVVVVVMSILLGIATAVDTNILGQGDDAERASDTGAIARLFENYYRVNAASTGPTYPTTSQVTNSLPTLLDGTDPNITVAPSQTTTSLISAADNTVPQSPAYNQYTYQPFDATGALCTTGACVKFKLYYRINHDGSVVTVDSMHQQ